MQMRVRPMRIGYLVNQYPKVSHSFIRREIAGIEACGIEVERFSIRSCEAELVDPLDLEELDKTWILFTMPYGLLLGMIGRALLLHPLRSLRSFTLSCKLGARSDTGLFKHWAYFFEACILLQWCRQERIDHLHAHFGTNSAALALLCHHLGGPSYSFTVHGPEEFDRSPGLYLDEKIRHASFVVAISSFGRSQLYRLCNYDQWSKIKVIRCGIDDLFLKEIAAPLPNSPQLVCVGRLCPQKGQLLLIEAVQRLRHLGIELKLKFVGDGPLRTELENLISDYQLEETITITGWVGAEQVRAELLNSLALVLPSLAEGLPVVIMESLGLGRPVLSTYIAGIPELVEPNVNGWLIPAGTVEDLTATLITLLQAEPEELKKMGQAGRIAASKKHNIYQETRSLANLFSQCRWAEIPPLNHQDLLDSSLNDWPSTSSDDLTETACISQNSSNQPPLAMEQNPQLSPERSPAFQAKSACPTSQESSC